MCYSCRSGNLLIWSVRSPTVERMGVMWPSGVRRAFLSGDQLLLYKRGLPYWGPKPKIDMLELSSIGVGAGPAGPFLAGPLFWRFNKIHYINCAHASHMPITAGPLQKSFLRPCRGLIVIQSVLNSFSYIQHQFPSARGSRFHLYMLGEIQFRCYEAKIEESEKAGSHWELNPGQLLA